MRYRQVRQLRLRLVLLDGGSWERTLTFREPLGDEAGIVFVLKKLIEPLQLAGPVEEMVLEFVGLTAETGKQRSLLFAEQARRRAQLLAALRQLKTRFGGESQVARVVEVEPWSRSRSAGTHSSTTTSASPSRVRVQADERGWPRAVLVEGVVAPRWRSRPLAHRRRVVAEKPVSRMYYQLQLEGDRVVTVYQDLPGGAWWLQRY
jgi:hypothetical protein